MNINNKIKVLNEQWTDIYYSLHYVDKENLSHQVIRILQFIDKNKEATIGYLSKNINTSANTSSEHIKRLIKKGFVDKHKSNEDERITLVTITEVG
jgi:DNA-binding MarR family transcriptional regulator